MQIPEPIIYVRQSQPDPRILRDRITCGYCNYSIYVHRVDGFTTYRCPNCTSVAIDGPTLDNRVWSVIIKKAEQLITDHEKFAIFASHTGTAEGKREALEILGVTVVLYRESDPEHDRYTIKVGQQPLG